MGWGTFAGKPLVNVHDLAVQPQFRRLGVGKALLQAAVDYARREGCGKVTLEALPHNTGALALYTGLGFASQASAVFWLCAPPLDAARNADGIASLTVCVCADALL